MNADFGALHVKTDAKLTAITRVAMNRQEFAMAAVRLIGGVTVIAVARRTVLLRVIG